jgi:ATP-dependent helicase YprA (DUF1998 family)
MNVPIDPHADFSRRAWLCCPNCDHGAGCPECGSNRNCGTHWQYLLSNDGPLVFLQCPVCAELWAYDAITQRRSRKAA